MASFPLLALRARISEQTPRDLLGVDLLAERLAARSLPAAPAIVGRRGPFGVTPWADDLDASRQVLAAAAAGCGRGQVLVAPDCAVGIATLPAVAAAHPAARVLWLDAHSDYDTPATTSYSFLGAMSLAGATGAWDTGFGAIPAGRVVLCGTRGATGQFDEAAQRLVEASEVTLLAAADHAQAPGLLGTDPVYVHLDTDVLDPVDNPLPYGRPGGLRLPELAALLAAVAARGPVVGIEVTAFHADADDPRFGALADALATLVAALRRAAFAPRSGG